MTQVPTIPDPESEPAPDRRELRAVVRRVGLFALGAWICFGAAFVIGRNWSAFLGLTCTAAVTIIHFLWLEEIVAETLRPLPLIKPGRLMGRAFARFFLLFVAIAILILVARFDALPVLLGFSVIVVGIFGEAVHSIWRNLRSAEGQPAE